MLVTMHFGDGSFKEIESDTDVTDPHEAVEQIKDWVLDNAWFEVMDEDGTTVLAEARLS